MTYLFYGLATVAVIGIGYVLWSCLDCVDYFNPFD